MSRLTLQTRATSLEAGTKTILETTTLINVTFESQNVLMPLSTILYSLELFGNNILLRFFLSITFQTQTILMENSQKLPVSDISFRSPRTT